LWRELVQVESWMLRWVLVAVVIVIADVASTVAQEASTVAQEGGRYQIVNVPLGLAGEGGGTTVLLDSQTGRTWHIILDERGRPRWRGIEFAGGSQGLAEAPDQRALVPGEAADSAPPAEEQQGEQQ
jgi:hypothetical protein